MSDKKTKAPNPMSVRLPEDITEALSTLKASTDLDTTELLKRLLRLSLRQTTKDSSILISPDASLPLP